MATPTQTIYADAAVTAPTEYVAPPNLDMEFASVRAKVNGAGASATFIMVLELLSQDGRIMAQSRIDQEFAVGDTGALTWAPFLSRKKRAASGQFIGAILTQSNGFGQTVPDGFAFNTTLQWDTETLDTDNMFTLADPTKLTCRTAGVYITRAQANYDNSVAGSYGISIQRNGNGTGPSNYWQAETQFGEGGLYHVAIQCIGYHVLSVGDYIEALVEQKTGGVMTLDGPACFFAAAFLGTT